MIDHKEGETDFRSKKHFDSMVSGEWRHEPARRVGERVDYGRPAPGAKENASSPLARSRCHWTARTTNRVFAIPFQRRISFRTYKYFFHPIYDTPFSLGIALPTDYGMYEIVAEEEVKLSSANGKRRTGWPTRATLPRHAPALIAFLFFSFQCPTFFAAKTGPCIRTGKRVGRLGRLLSLFAFAFANADRFRRFCRVYCEYHYPEYRDFDTAEEQVVHFLNRATQPAWKWKSVRPRPLDQNVYMGEFSRIRLPNRRSAKPDLPSLPPPSE